MPTVKKRITITVRDDLYGSLNRLSTRENKTLSGMSLCLIEKAIELEEDSYLSHEADKRLAKNQRRTSHAKVWDAQVL